MLDHLGFSPSADAIYKHLVTRSAASPAELKVGCGLDAATVASELVHLIARGVVRPLDDTSERYAAVSPDFAIESLVQAKEEELRAVRVGVQRLMPIFRSAQVKHSEGVVELVHGSDNVRQVVDQLQMISTTQVRAMTRPPYVCDPAVSSNVETAKLANSVQYRCIWDKATLELPGMFEAVREDARNGEEVRVYDGVPIKVFIADDRLAVISVSRLALDTCDALIVHPSELLTGLCALFDVIWQCARPLGSRAYDTIEATTGATPALGATQRRLLEMLGSGMTDESIARSLGWNVRTVQRHVRRIMDGLGADTRLQAGVAAAKRGWL